jgi:threonine aldolase
MSSRSRDRPIRFISDNTATACPEILAAIVEANQGLAPPYGADRWTERIDEAFSAFCGREVRAFPVITGTAANALALGTIAAPYSTIFAHEESHVARDEFGAPEFFSGGARVVPVAGAHGKLSVDSLASALHANPPSMSPAAVSLSQATDLGTVYRPDEIASLSELAHRNGLRVHVDGARFANALVFLDCHPADLTWRSGVDVLSFGATKNGTLGAEAVVFFDPASVHDFDLRRRRSGHLLSKSRYLSAQLVAFLDPRVWRANAARANRLAQCLARASSRPPIHPVEANEVFLRLDQSERERLRAAGFEFDDWAPLDSDQARFVVSWDQLEDDIDALIAELATVTVQS